MQIVIDIPKNIYNTIRDDLILTYEQSFVLNTCIYRGTVLPKGHGRLIDEGLLRDEMKSAYRLADELVALGFAEVFLDDAPTVIEADTDVGEKND